MLSSMLERGAERCEFPVAEAVAPAGLDLPGHLPPGITGLWQISGRNNTTYAERTRLDEYYVQNWSILLDVYILLCTVRAVFRAEGAY